MGDQPNQTEGEHRVGLDFNPSGDERVQNVKEQTAHLIDELDLIAKDRNHPGARCAALAMTAFEDAAMWAVKAITKKPRS